MVQQPEQTSHDKQLVSLGRVLQTLREEENAEVLVDSVLTYLHGELDYSVIWVGLYDHLEHRILGKGGIAPNSETAFLKQRFVLNPGDLLEQVVIQQRPLAVPDLREELRAGEWRKAAKGFNIQGTVIFPIRHRDRCYGVTLLGSSEWGASPRSEEKARLSMILGGLGAALFHIEATWLRQQTKRPDQPLLSLLTRLRSLSGLGTRLEAIVEQTHTFIQPSRTNVYWFERERRYFWRKLSNRQRTGFSEANQPASGITVQEVSSFYQALVADQLVSIGEAHSSLKADTTSRLMQQIKARSLLAAPILFKEELLGFLAVEGTEPRIWEEEERNFIRAAAQMVALTVPLDEMEAAIDQIRLDRALTAEVAHSIYSENDWKAALKTTAEQMCQRLNVDRFLVVVHDRDLGQFEVCYQNYPSQRRPLPSTLEMLNEADWSLLEKSSGAVAIENLDGELQHLTWRDRLLELGVRSVLLCSTSIGHALEGIVLLCQETPRTWNALERELLKVVSQQIGLMLHQWQLQQQADQQQKISQTLQWGLTTIQHTHQLDLLERSALQNLTQVLQVPMAALVAWSPGRDAGRVMTSGAGTERFTLNTSMTIPVNTDPLVQWALESDELISVTIGEIATETRQWLTGTGIGQVLAMALRTAADHAPTGIILVLEGSDRRWSERHLSAFRTVVSQIAWSRRSVMLTAMLATQREELERLNWYKHRRLEDAYRSLSTHLRRLLEVGNLKDALAGTRQQQIVRQINDAIVPLAQLIQEEPWRLRLYSQTMPLVTLLKRSLERVDGLIKQRQLWSQVHNEVNPTISGDITKIELVLYELLLASCLRSEVGARLDIWCRQVDAQWLELSITDSGRIDPRLIADLEMGRSLDLLAASTLNQPPGLHLMICQTLMKQMGGECTLFKLEDDRILSRLMLPILQNQ